MNLTEDRSTAKYTIRCYQAGEIQVHADILRNTTERTSKYAQYVYKENLILTSEEIYLKKLPEKFSDFAHEHLEFILSLQPKIILLGCGTSMQFLAPSLISFCTSQRIGIEIMLTQAACHAYNVLMSEHRAAIAALFL